MKLSQDFVLFKHIHQTLVLASFWIETKVRPSCLELTKFMAKYAVQ